MSQAIHIFAYHGPDPYLFHRDFKKAKDAFVSPQMRAMAVLKYNGQEISEAELEDELFTMPFGSDYKIIHLHEYQKIKFRKKFLAMLKTCPSHCQLFLSTPENKDPNPEIKAFFKTAKNAKLILCPLPNLLEMENRIAVYLKDKGHGIEDDAKRKCAEYLMAEAELLETELEKLCLFANLEEKINIKHIDALLAALHPENVFELVHHVLSKNRKLALKALMAFLNDGGSLIFLQTLLYNEIKKLIYILENLPKGMETAFKSAGVFYFEAKKKSRSYIKKHTLKEATHWLNALSELERVLKSESLINENRDQLSVNLIAKSLLIKMLATP